MLASQLHNAEGFEHVFIYKVNRHRQILNCHQKDLCIEDVEQW